MTNHTWGTAALGADTLTLQAEMLQEHCIPNAATAGCVYTIAVYGWMNSSYTILATLDEGWGNPTRLLDGQPQSGYVAQGAYRYYKYTVSQDVATALVFTLTPTDGSDQVTHPINILLC